MFRSSKNCCQSMSGSLSVTTVVICAQSTIWNNDALPNLLWSTSKPVASAVPTNLPMQMGARQITGRGAEVHAQTVGANERRVSANLVQRAYGERADRVH